MHDVTAGQLALLFVSAALFAAGAILSFGRRREGPGRPRVAAKAAQYLATAAGVGVLAWHAVARGSWRPLEDNFDALVWLGLLLALFVLYTQRAHPLRGLEWFVIPIVILLLVSAAVFGKARPHEYNQVGNVWAWTHLVTSYGGAVAFAVAGAVGLMYLVAQRRLRSKRVATGPNLGSLERMEHLTFVSVTLGFSLLTIGAVTGIVRWFEAGRTTPVYKLVLTAAVWLVYATILHSPINPSFRGRKTAMLSVLGFVLMVGTLVAVQFMPPG